MYEKTGETNGELNLLNDQQISEQVQTVNTAFTLQEDVVTVDTKQDRLDCYLTGDNSRVSMEILGRQFKIGDGVMAQGLVFSPFVDLLTSQSLKGYLDRYRYVRFDAKLKLVFNTTPDMYGYIALVPIWMYDPVVREDRYDYWSTPGLTLLDISSREAVEITLPYCLPVEWINVGQASYDDIFFPTIYVHSFSVSGNEVSPTVDYEAYASMENVSVAGPKAYAQMDVVSTIAAANSIMQVSDKFVKTASGFYETVKEYLPGSEEGDPKSEKDDGEGYPTRLSMYGDLSLTRYRPDCNYLGARKYSFQPGVQLTPHDTDFTWKRLMTNQVFCEEGELSSLSPVKTVSISPHFYGGWLKAVVESHRFWRGSLNISVIFFASPLTSARITNFVTWGTVTGVGDNFSDVITVQGTTVRQYNVPYLRDSHWKSTRDGDDEAPQLIVSLDSAIKSVTKANPTVSFLIFMSAGPDFTVRGYQSPTKPKAYAQMDVTQMHSDYSGFQPILGLKPVRVDTHETDGVEDVMRRYSTRPGREWSLQALAPTDTGVNYDPDTYDWWLYRAARFVSGSIRVKTTLDGLNQVAEIALQPSGIATSNEWRYKAGDGMVVQDTTHWNVAEFEIPYYCSWPCVSSNLNFVSYQQVAPTQADISGGIDNVPIRSYVSAGRDFKMYILMPAPVISVY